MLSFIARSEYDAVRGFTLVETLVAVSVLLVVVVGPMTIASRGMQNAYYAGDQTTAIYLAQEAIEYVQRLRDNEALEHFDDFTGGQPTDGDTWDWYDTLDPDCKQTDGCDIDFSSLAFSRDCTTASQCRLNHYTGSSVSTQNRVYAYTGTAASDGDSWQASPFTRRIYVGPLTNGGVPVTVTVSWDASSLFGVGTTKSVRLQTYLYDHYERYE
jgi:prepilin-type N-terminal cleavage/methylation domain-containing protein